MKLGFIGAGNMGGAIIRGFINSKKVAADNINVIRKNTKELGDMGSELGINTYTDYLSLINDSDVIFMAVKPIMFPTVIAEIKDTLKSTDKLLVSMAAGLSTDSICDMLGYEFPVIRIMPNINAQIMLSTTAVCRNEKASEESLENIADLFNSIGMAVEVAEPQFAVFSAIAGCSPAYVYMFIDALARGAVKMGMNKKQAVKIAASAVAGSAEMVLKSGIHPVELTDMVCSPGGTTIEGVTTLDEYGFTSAVTKAVVNSVLKDKMLSGK